MFPQVPSWSMGTRWGPRSMMMVETPISMRLRKSYQGSGPSLGCGRKNQDFSSRWALIFPYLPMETSMHLTVSTAFWRHLSSTINAPNLPPNCRQKLKEHHDRAKFGGVWGAVLARGIQPGSNDEIGIDVRDCVRDVSQNGRDRSALRLGGGGFSASAQPLLRPICRCLGRVRSKVWSH